MEQRSRRRFLGLLAGAATASAGAEAQAPPRISMNDADERRRRLVTALRELNDAGGLGVTADELERALPYATAAILEADAKLRPLVLGAGLELPVVFAARRKG